MRTVFLSTCIVVVCIGAGALAWSGMPSARAEEEPERTEPAAPSPATIPMDDTPAELPPVVVTGTPIGPSAGPLVRKGRPDEAVPRVDLRAIGSRDVFGPERVRETGARDVNDLVQHLPALSARPYNGGEAAAPSFSMRGLPDDGLTEYVHVLIDGVPASPLPYGWTAFSFLPITTDRIHAIDYLRGAHSVRYSPNTVGGILNFITEPIPTCPQARIRTTLGSNGYSSVLARAGGTHGRFGWMATVVDRRGDGYRDNGGFEQQDVNLKVRYALGRDSWIAASFSHIQSDHQAPGGLTRAQFDANRFANARPENAFEGDRQVADVVLHVGQGGCGWLEAFAYGSRTWRNLRAQRPHFGAPATMSDWRDESWFVGGGVRFERTLHIAGCEHTIYGGVRYHREWIPSWKLRTEPFPGGPGVLTQDARYETDAISMHIDDTFHPGPRWTVRAGLRLEWIPNTEGHDRLGGFDFDDEFARVLPGVGVSYQVSRHAALFANYFEGFRAPQVWGYGFASGNGNLDFEQGRSAELGARVEDWHGLTGSVTGWHTTYDDFGVFYTGFYENLGRIEAMGVDLVAAYEFGCLDRRLTGLSLDAALTLQDSTLRTGANKGNQTPYAWRQKGSLRLRYERAGWLASFGGTYVGRSYADEANTSTESADGTLGVNPATWLWDARAAKRVTFNRRTRLEVAAGVTNLFDHDWYVHSRGGFFGGGLVAGPPRQLYLSANLDIDL